MYATFIPILVVFFHFINVVNLIVKLFKMFIAMKL